VVMAKTKQINPFPGLSRLTATVLLSGIDYEASLDTVRILT
jgi:hypothetical protein